MKTRRSILSLIFGAAAAPAAVAVAKAMPETEVVGTFRRVSGAELLRPRRRDNNVLRNYPGGFVWSGVPIRLVESECIDNQTGEVVFRADPLLSVVKHD